MSRTRTTVATSPFGMWLDSQMNRFGTYQKRVVLRSGLGQSTVAGYLSGARRPEKRDLVEKLVGGLLPDGASADLADEVLHDGLIAAGFSAPPLPPAAALVREQLARYDGGGAHLSPEDMDALIADIEALGASLVGSRVERAQKQGQSA